jgi:hypothetical protein
MNLLCDTGCGAIVPGVGNVCCSSGCCSTNRLSFSSF